ncbi:MAG: NAD(P)/FAD-dependent oxidoreductase [Bacteroidota bacterium]
MIKKQHIVIVGAGLCGTLLGIRLVQRGYRVSLFERRPDLRLIEQDAGRSINLALSHRGLMALATAGLGEVVRDLCIPMRGRMIHAPSGEKWLSPYSGRTDEYINSISRPGLNALLLEKADSYENLTIYFEYKCTGVNLETATGHFTDKSGEAHVIQGDILVGTDGAGSVVRRAMMARSTDLLFNFSQNFLRSGYKELSIPASASGDFRIESNALHIWPRGKFMMIALPNLDRSFTVTMFHPFDGPAGFNTLNTPEKVKAFFNEHYPDTLEHLPDLDQEYFTNPSAALGTIKCYPWEAYKKTLLMGDAAHAIVPFYGQGMNAAFEDVRIFDELVEQHDGDWSAILPAFSEARPTDSNAIADLAVDNFYEMQDKVDDVDFIKKRKLEMKLEQQFPEYYSKYSLVTFKPELSYNDAMIRGRRQDEYLLDLVNRKDVDELDLAQVVEKVNTL